MTTHYEVLGLPAQTSLTPQLIKAAYRKALLKHHPDKAGVPSSSVNDQHYSKSAHSVDKITEAYSVLSSPKSRADYDRELTLQTRSQSKDESDIFRTGVEVVDLDDLDYDETEGSWYRSCRCGDNRGFLFKEDSLEDAADDGELNVGCRGCSLWLRVLFGVLDGEVEKT
jgi:curved DNA-binding protein CbpA